LGFAFSGIGDEYVKLPSDLFPAPKDGFGSVPFTFELWFQTSSNGVILAQQNLEPFEIPTGYVPGLYVGTNGLLYAYMFWGLDDVLVSAGPVNDGQWHQVVVTYDGLMEVLYLDGLFMDMTPGSQFGYDPNYKYQLGTGYTGGWPDATGHWFPFAGIIDEVSVYNRAFSAQEVADLYALQANRCVGPILRQRYSFNEPVDATTVLEARRGGHGLLLYANPESPYTNGVPDGSGFTGEGQLRLAGQSGYVQLPPQLASLLTVATFEAWVTWHGPATSSWQRIFDFGSNDRGFNASGTGTNYIVLSPAIGGTEVLGFQQTTVNPFGSEVDANALILSGPERMPMNRELYLVVIYDPTKGASRFYINGQLISQINGKTLNLLSEIVDFNCWLGRSQWQRDPHFNGSYNEFRIWDGALSDLTIAEHYAAGPDQHLGPVLSPLVEIDVKGNAVMLSWPGDATGYTVETAVTMDGPEWQSVIVIPEVIQGKHSVTLTNSGATTYYRLVKEAQ
jgi:hypothetical protein